MLNKHPLRLEEKRPPSDPPLPKEKQFKSGHDGPIDGVPLPDNATSAGDRRAENERRFQKLKEEIAKALASSNTAMGALKAAMGQPRPMVGGMPCRHQQSAIELVKTLIDQPFEIVTSWLVKAHESLLKTSDVEGISAIVNTSHWLIPWLCISGTPIDVDWWGGKPLGPIISLPAGPKTFAEIVMAGLDRRKVAFVDIADKKISWWNSNFAVEFFQPESGIQDEFEHNLREDLWKKFAPPPDLINEKAELKDQAIAAQLEYYSMEEHITAYLICTNIPESEPDRSDFMARINRIKSRYQALAIVGLDKSLAVVDQNVFNKIRRLLQPVETSF